jgi:diacylglycerol kinase family enzyme
MGDKIIIQAILSVMNEYSSITIIYNDFSTGESELNARAIAKKLERTQYKDVVKLIVTERPDHARKIAYEITKREARPLIISSSGDGGYHEVINGALEAADAAHTPVTGLLPSGNANDHYKQLHQPHVIDRIESGTVQTIDVLKIESRINGRPWHKYAHSYIGFGLSSEVGKALNEVDLNSTNELLIFLKTFVKNKPFTIVVGDHALEYQSIILSNVGKMSKVLSLSKTAKVDDGLFEILTSDANVVKLMGTLVKSVAGVMAHEDRTSSYSCITTHPLNIQLDGEIYTIDKDSEIHISSCHKALRCVI